MCRSPIFLPVRRIDDIRAGRICPEVPCRRQGTVIPETFRKAGETKCRVGRDCASASHEVVESVSGAPSRATYSARGELAALVDRGRGLAGRDAVADGVHLAARSRPAHRGGCARARSPSPAPAHPRRSAARNRRAGRSPWPRRRATPQSRTPPRTRPRDAGAVRATASRPRVRTISRPTKGSGVTRMTLWPRSARCHAVPPPRHVPVSSSTMTRCPGRAARLMTSST